MWSSGGSGVGWARQWASADWGQQSVVTGGGEQGWLDCDSKGARSRSCYLLLLTMYVFVICILGSFHHRTTV